MNAPEVGRLGLDAVEESLERAARAIAEAADAYWGAPLALDGEARKLERAVALIEEVLGE